MFEWTTRKRLRAGTFSTTFLLHYLLECFSQNIGIHGTECFLQNTDMLAQIYNEVVHHIPQVNDQVHKQCRSLGNPSTKCAQWLQIQHQIFRGLGEGGEVGIFIYIFFFLPISSCLSWWRAVFKIFHHVLILSIKDGNFSLSVNGILETSLHNYFHTIPVILSLWHWHSDSVSQCTGSLFTSK